jgi:hypothetical protein
MGIGTYYGDTLGKGLSHQQSVKSVFVVVSRGRQQGKKRLVGGRESGQKLPRGDF